MSEVARSRTWTPSPVRCASRSSSPNDSPHHTSGSKRDGAAFKTPFIVTDASPRSLNPTAKSFAPMAPAHGGNAVFAMPASRSTLPSASVGVTVPSGHGNGTSAREGPSIRREGRPLPVSDAMTWSAAVTLRGGPPLPHHYAPLGLNSTTAPIHAVSTAAAPPMPVLLDDAAVQREAEAYVREVWTAVCVARGFHMVMVMNLAPRTCEADLSRMFFPMGASKVSLMEAKDMPAALANSLQSGHGWTTRRRLGVVFFDRKDFAMVGVEKLDNFVPSGQHQPLVVRYCGPDAEGTPLPGAAEPHAAGESLWMPSATDREIIQEEMVRVFGQVKPSMTMVAVHGLDPVLATSVLRQSVVPSGAVGCEPWPPQQQAALAPISHAHYAKYKSISAVAWYPGEETARAAVQLLDGRMQLGQRQPIHLAVLLPSACSPRNSQSPLSPAPFRRGQPRHVIASPPPPPSTTTTALNASVASQVNTSVKSATSAISVYTDPANTSTEVLAVYDKLDQEWLAAHPDPKIHLVGVHNLVPNTTNAALLKIFYPMGALNVAVHDTPVVLHGKARVSGVAFFSSKGMAEEAAKKINDFVPHGQSRPLVARYLSRDGNAKSHAAFQASTPRSLSGDYSDTTPSSVPTANRFASVAPPHAASTPRRHGADSLPSAASVSELLLAIEEHLAARPLNSDFLTLAMTQLAEHSNSGEEEAERLGHLLVSALLEANHHSITLSTPISNALYQLHENLHIPRRGQEAETELERNNIRFVRGIARSMLSLLVDSRRAREPRSVAAVVCAYLFDFCYLGSPYDFAVRNFHKYAKELEEARTLLTREAGVPTTQEEQAKVSTWVTLMDCLKDLTSQWSNANKVVAKQDPYQDEFQQFLDQFYGADRHQSDGTGSVRGRRGHTSGYGASTPTQPALVDQRSPYSADLLGSASMRRMVPSSTVHGESELVTPSARPTPRRVVERVSPSSATRHLKSQPSVLGTQTSSTTGIGSATVTGATPGISGVGMDIPHVVLTPFSDRTQGISTDISLESNHTAAAQAVAAALSTPSVPMTESPYQYGRSDNSNCTVYVTKLPSHFTSCQVRRLLMYFGTINKVRLCRDDKENGGATAMDGCDVSGGMNSGKNPYNRLSFGFVEFAESRSAKAMIEYFRNQNQSPAAFSFLLPPPGVASTVSYLTEDSIQLLGNTRTSKARSPIHDEHPLDAELRLMSTNEGGSQANHIYLRVRPCQFGLLLPNEPVENYSDVCENVLQAAATRAAALETTSAPCMGVSRQFATDVTQPTTEEGCAPAKADHYVTAQNPFMSSTVAPLQPTEQQQHQQGNFGTSAFFDPAQWAMEPNDSHHSISQFMGDDSDETDAVLKEALDALLAVDPAVEDDDD